MPRKPLHSLLAATVLTLASTCAFAQTVIIAPHAPPPPRAEVVPPPRAGYAWDPGHWRWEGGGYRWVPGHWAARGPNWRWVPGHWA